jgi:hypothetical protein
MSEILLKSNTVKSSSVFAVQCNFKPPRYPEQGLSKMVAEFLRRLGLHFQGQEQEVRSELPPIEAYSELAEITLLAIHQAAYSIAASRSQLEQNRGVAIGEIYYRVLDDLQVGSAKSPYSLGIPVREDELYIAATHLILAHQIAYMKEDLHLQWNSSDQCEGLPEYPGQCWADITGPIKQAYLCMICAASSSLIQRIDAAHTF